MHPNFMKSKIFATLALLIMTIAFTFPMIAFHGTLKKINDGKVEEISSLSKSVWNLYNHRQYKNTLIPKESRNNLDGMIKGKFEIGVASLPVWTVISKIPSYPKEIFPEGLPIFIHLDGFSGEIYEINTVLKYMGRDSIELSGQWEQKIGVYILLVLTLFMICFITYKHKIFYYAMLIPASLPILFILDYSYWLYLSGHTIHEWAAFKIKPFMPTVFGKDMIGGFITYSYPAIGFYLLVAISLLSILAFFARWKEMRETEILYSW